MRIVEKLLYGVGGMLALILLFIVVCHFNPSIAQMVGENIEVSAQESKIEPSKEGQAPIKQLLGNHSTTFPVTLTEEGKEQLKVPKELLDRTGYVPVKEKPKQISDRRAEEIEDILSTGSTGEDFEYKEIMYPYYYMLGETEQKLYRQIHANMNDVNTSFAPVEKAVTAGQLKNAFTAVVNDHPEIFWINTEYQYQYVPSGQIYEIDLSFNYTTKNLEQAKVDFDAAAMDIIYGSRGLIKKYDLEVYVHNALLDKAMYDRNAPINQSAYSALVNKRTVCAGYARAYQYVLQQLEIPCYYCTGFAGENHAWNIVMIEDGFYNVDTTWDDTDPNTYDYFNCSDADYAPTHVRTDMAVNLPPCNANKYRALEVVEEEPEKEEEVSSEEDKDAQTEEDTIVQQIPGDQVQITINRGGVSNDGNWYLTTLKDYYLDCAQMMLADHDNHISFVTRVVDETLWKEIMAGYEDGSFEGAFMERVLADKHKAHCAMNVTAEKQEDGTYLVYHDMTLQ